MRGSFMAFLLAGRGLVRSGDCGLPSAFAAPPTTTSEEIGMKRIGWVAVLVAFLGGCAEMAHHEGSGAAWTDMIDGSMSQFDRVGDANWRMEGGAIVADKGTGFLYSKKSYGDFEIRVEFYAESDSNSGIFLRCQDTKD